MAAMNDISDKILLVELRSIFFDLWDLSGDFRESGWYVTEFQHQAKAQFATIRKPHGLEGLHNLLGILTMLKNKHLEEMHAITLIETFDLVFKVISIKTSITYWTSCR